MPPTPPHVIALVGSSAADRPALQLAAETLDGFGVAWVERAAAQELPEGVRAVIVTSPDGLLPAALAARTAAPVIRVPVGGADDQPAVDLLTGPDAWPAGAPTSFATVAIGETGARNAALLVVSILALNDKRLHTAWLAYRQAQTVAVLSKPAPWKPS